MDNGWVKIVNNGWEKIMNNGWVKIHKSKIDVSPLNAGVMCNLRRNAHLAVVMKQFCRRFQLNYISDLYNVDKCPRAPRVMKKQP